MTKMKETWRKLTFFPALLLGAALLFSVVKGRTPPERVAPEERIRLARIIPTPELAFLPRATAHGLVRPGRVWRAVAQVSGQVLEIHRDLKQGAILPKGAELVRLDPVEYQLTVARLRANIRGVEARMAELAVKKENAQASLTIERQSLALIQKELERKRELVKSRTTSGAALDQAQREVLASRQGVRNLQNTLDLIPTEKKALEAERTVYQAQLAQAQLDLEHTVITAPFDLRVAEVNLETSQFVSRGELLAVGDGLAVAEVVAQLSLERLSGLLLPNRRKKIDPTTIMAELPDLLGVVPEVRLQVGERTMTWPARLARISDAIDPQTRTVGVIVAVDHPYRQARPGLRPPLSKNMFVDVHFQGRAQANKVVAPRKALRDGHFLHLVGKDNRLEIRPVEIFLRQDDFIVVEKGLSAGERVVLTDLTPAVVGMKIKPTVDEAALAELVFQASGSRVGEAVNPVTSYGTDYLPLAADIPVVKSPAVETLKP
ncbi:MAG: HlyD family efflux transporter periplasmic adaptor subunit [Magnetococcales bacterium]|nr:HlyD family efflux transporter periplasmic adaptor subunit [Magnetococcales bacterium]